MYVNAGNMGQGVFEELPGMLAPAKVTDVTVWGVQITGGELKATLKPRRKLHVSKTALCANLLRLVKSRSMELPRDLREADAMVRELRAVKPNQTATTGAMIFEAEKSGDRDDLVVALAMASVESPTKAQVRVIPVPEGWY